MKKNEVNLIIEYLFRQLHRYEEAEQYNLTNIRFRASDAVDCFELARAKDNLIMFKQFARDIMVLLHLAEDNSDFDLKYSDFVQAVREDQRRRFRT